MNGSSRFAAAKNPAARRGAVFIIVLWIATGLVTLALLLGESVVLDARLAGHRETAARTGQAVEGAARYILHRLDNLDEPGLVPGGDEIMAEGAAVGDCFYWLIGRDADNPNPAEPFFGLVPENSKLNINTATLEMLLELPEMTGELAGAIVDWRDADDEVSDNGAETDAYALMKWGYGCKNAPFASVAETALLHGADHWILFGEDMNANGALDANENDAKERLPADDRDGELDFGVLEYLTVYGREPNQNAAGEARIDVTGSERDEWIERLEAVVGSERAEGAADRIARVNNPQSLLELYVRGGFEADEFEAIENEIAVTDEEYLLGRINVNCAPAAVLACVPGIDESSANALVNYRKSRSGDALKSIAWVAGVLDESAAAQAGPYLTTRSYQFAADIAAAGPSGDGFRRVAFVLDTSEGSARVVRRSDRTGLGWALGERIRREFQQRREVLP